MNDLCTHQTSVVIYSFLNFPRHEFYIHQCTDGCDQVFVNVVDRDNGLTVAQLPTRAAVAWGVAWPFTQLGLLVQPGLAHYGGLSGVLHAGVAVAALWLLVMRSGRQRLIGGAIGLGLLIKILLEEPWGSPLRVGGGWDIATAPLAHATGAAAGLVCAALALLLERRQTGRR